MAIRYLFLFIFALLHKPHKINSSACTLDFTRFPYEAQSECFDMDAAASSCCSSALQSLFQAMTLKSNQSRSIFLNFLEAQNCTNIFENLHNRINLNKCELQDFISSSTRDLCSNNVDQIVDLIGVESYNELRFNCKDLSSRNHSDEVCFDCVFSYRKTLQALKERNRSSDKGCAEALLVSLASSDVQSPNFVQGAFSCLWNEIQSPWPTQKSPNKAYILGSKKLLAIVIVAVALILSGKCYVGIMPSGMPTVIKKLNQGIRVPSFVDEACRKAKIRHPNLVSTLGYCDKGEHCLVYEHCVNGSLAGWLFGNGAGNVKAPILTWERRMQISIGVARGLCFLHANPLDKMVHGDVKVANIFLTEKLEAKIIDSDLSSFKPHERKGLLTIKTDVFDFGFLLLQVLTGKKAKSLIEEARDAIMKGASISAMADPRLNGAYVASEFRNVLAIAVRCTAPNEGERPYMEEVVRKLEETQNLV
ncbi:protein STRUBBELIG-RECEPTOR FAMILY 8-like [Pyrus ussuriensis x Pyrus communis]|uniref:Protein STRUBBELIG-RECEPTOR FAMILY 8-like n=1 Tax=Pyrus ussuriensis x Pyrus communis TaxID=2448454 RepID=A0A5N5GUF7_9ROSA|nr:protein STRUBBELIG-RECEPTOR FAMILY 8-like [Pyrus ussuriensis x Pyrus communis]